MIALAPKGRRSLKLRRVIIRSADMIYLRIENFNPGSQVELTGNTRLGNMQCFLKSMWQGNCHLDAQRGPLEPLRNVLEGCACSAQETSLNTQGAARLCSRPL